MLTEMAAIDEDDRIRHLGYHCSRSSQGLRHCSPPPNSMTPTKPNSKLLSLLLQAIVMAVVASLFFVFIGIAALVLVHIFIAGRAFRRRRSHWSNPAFQTLQSSDSGLSMWEIQKLPSCIYSDSWLISSSSDCAVCLEGFRDGDRCRVLPPCGHLFHVECVDRWLVKASACPICRGDVDPKKNFIDEGDYSVQMSWKK